MVSQEHFGGSWLDILIEAFVNQYFYINTPVDVPAKGITVWRSCMGSPIARGCQDSPHRNISRVAQVLCHRRGPFIAQFLVKCLVPLLDA
jgi:hypothetical protein